jgi:hypothetical protein
LSQPALYQQLLVATKRDRIGQELKKAFSNPSFDFAGGLMLLAETGLFGAVMLGVPQDSSVPHGEMAWHAARRATVIQKLLVDAPPQPCLIGLILAACFWELKAGKSGERVKESDLYDAVVNMLRLSHLDAEAAVICVRGAVRLRELTNEPPSRLQLGLCLRMCGVLWTSAWMLAVAVDEDLHRLELFVSLKLLVNEMQLEGVWTMKPLLNGNEISKLLGIAPGPVFAVLTEKLVEEQLKRPSMTCSEAQEFLFRLHKGE